MSDEDFCFFRMGGFVVCKRGEIKRKKGMCAVVVVVVVNTLNESHHPPSVPLGGEIHSTPPSPSPDRWSDCHLASRFPGRETTCFELSLSIKYVGMDL